MTDTRGAGHPVAAREEPGGVAARRWPRPTPVTLVLLLVWLAGIVVATVVPWLIVPPTADDPATADVWLAAAASTGGIVVFAAAGILEYARTRNGTVLTWALIPAVAVGSGVLIFTATLLSV